MWNHSTASGSSWRPNPPLPSRAFYPIPRHWRPSNPTQLHHAMRPTHSHYTTGGLLPPPPPLTHAHSVQHPTYAPHMLPTLRPMMTHPGGGFFSGPAHHAHHHAVQQQHNFQPDQQMQQHHFATPVLVAASSMEPAVVPGTRQHFANKMPLPIDVAQKKRRGRPPKTPTAMGTATSRTPRGRATLEDPRRLTTTPSVTYNQTNWNCHTTVMVKPVEVIAPVQPELIECQPIIDITLANNCPMYPPPFSPKRGNVQSLTSASSIEDIRSFLPEGTVLFPIMKGAVV